MYGGWGRVLFGGSNRLSALPTDSKRSRALPESAMPTNNPLEACGFADLGRFNLWRPMVVDRTGGSELNRSLPGGSK